MLIAQLSDNRKRLGGSGLWGAPPALIDGLVQRGGCISCCGSLADEDAVAPWPVNNRTLAKHGIHASGELPAMWAESSALCARVILRLRATPVLAPLCPGAVVGNDARRREGPRAHRDGRREQAARARAGRRASSPCTHLDGGRRPSQTGRAPPGSAWAGSTAYSALPTPYLPRPPDARAVRIRA